MKSSSSENIGWLRHAVLIAEDRVALAGLGFVIVLGIMANCALHAGNYQMGMTGSTSGAIGAVSAAQALGIVMAAPLLGLLAARASHINLVLVATSIAATGFLAIFIAQSMQVALLGRFVLGCGIGLGMAFAEYLVISRAQSNLRPLFATLFGVLLAAGHALGTLLTGVAQPAVLIALVSMLLGISVLLAPWGSLMISGKASTLADFKSVIRINPALFLAAALFGFLDNGFLTMLPDFFEQAGISRQSVILTSFAAFAGICVFQIPAGLLSVRFEAFAILQATILLLIGGIMAMMLLIDISATHIPAAFVLGGMVDVLYTVGLIGLAASMPVRLQPAANACFVSFCGLGEVAGPLVTGPTLQSFGLAGGVAVVLYLLAVYWIGSALMNIRSNTRRADTTSALPQPTDAPPLPDSYAVA